MNHKNDKWVRRFLVTDPTLHEKQFTIYKVTSIVFPKGMPEAATKVIIWKRYSDFKKLHDDIKLLCKSLKIQDFPRLEKSTFFKRFDTQVIENRCKTVLRMLEFIADHSLLFTSDVFTKFLQTNNFIDAAAINTSGPQVYEPTEPKSFDPTKHANDCLSYCSTDSRSSSAVDTDSAICSSVLSVDVPYIDSVSPNSSSHFKIDSKEFESSKLSSDSLLSNPSFESASTRTALDNSVNQKYRMLLSTNFGDGKLEDDQVLPDSNAMCRISFCQQDLRRYHIIGILKHLMYVQDKVSKRFCVIKGVPKSVGPGHSNKMNILPHYSKNMVRLYHAVETETSLYLILEYIKHVKLWDHLTNYFNQKSYRKESSSPSSSNKSKADNHRSGKPFNALTETARNDTNRDDSYSALIRNYRANSRKISKSLLDVQTQVVECESAIEKMTQKEVKNRENATEVSHFIETGSKEEDNFNKLMRKIDLIMEDKEKDVCTRSTPDVSKLTVAPANLAAVTLNKRLPDDNLSSFSELSNTFSSKFNGSLASIDSINDNLDYTSPKFIDEDDSSKSGITKFNFDANSDDFSLMGRTNFSSLKDDAISCGSTADQIKSTNEITSDSDINVIKDSCYKVLSQIEAVLNKQTESDSRFEFAERLEDSSVKSQDDKMTQVSSDTVDLIDKAQQLLDSVNQTLQRCESKTNHQKIRLTKANEHCVSFEGFHENGGLPKLKNRLTEEEPLQESHSVALKLAEMKLSKGRGSTLDDAQPTAANLYDDRSSCLRDECNLNIDLTGAHDKKFKCLDDVGAVFCNFEHSTLSPQIVMSEESIFNFKFIFADPASVTDDRIRRWAGEILVALESLHLKGILCWDLNPENILLSQDGTIKLTYFYRHSKVLPIWSRDALEGYYVAPELLTCPAASPDESQDWWSYGVLLFHLLTGKSLSSHLPEGVHPHSTMNIPETISTEANLFLSQLLQYEPQQRLGSGPRGVEEIKSHTYFNNFDWG